MKVSSHTSGSWFPTGYYGHHRMKNRVDFINEYRQLAKPAPPDTFLRRSSQPASSHVFSRHDNKLLMHRDVTSFGQGVGKKKHPERSENVTSHMARSSFGGNSDYPMTSTYRQAYKMEEPNIQMLVRRPKTSFDHLSTTIYRTIHGTDSPNCHLINAMNNESLMLTLQSRQQQAKLRQKDCQESVASCMSWYKPSLPPVVCNPDFNYVDMRPIIDSKIKACNFPQTSLTSTALECHAQKSVLESPHCVKNTSE